MAQALAQGYLWREAEVALKGCGISIGGGDIAWLHGDKLLVGLEVKVLRQHAGTDKLLLKDSNKVEQVLGLTATNVINGIGSLPRPLLKEGSSATELGNLSYLLVLLAEIIREALVRLSPRLSGARLSFADTSPNLTCCRVSCSLGILIASYRLPSLRRYFADTTPKVRICPLIRTGSL